jgi:AraC-like DNA-binding protein
LDITFTLFDLVLLVGVAQGFVIASLIWTRNVIRHDQLLLSLLLCVFNLLCIKIIVLSSGLWQQPAIRYFPLPFDLAIQPLSYLYISSLTTNDFKLNRRKLLHFIPFFISLAYSIFVYLAVLPWADISQKDSLANRLLFDEVKEAEDFILVCSAVIYWLQSRRQVTHYRQWLYRNTSDTLLPTYTWLKNILSLFGIFFIIVSVNIILDYGTGFGKRYFFHWQLAFVYLAILIYYLGFKGYQTKATPIVQPVPAEVPVSDPPPAKKSEEEPTDPGLTQLIISAFTEQKVHLDPELTLQALSKKLNLHTVVVSKAINTHLHRNFRNLVNEYRVKEVIKKLSSPNASHLSLLGIAYESGFNSEASFYRIFKSITGVSPKEYLLQLSSEKNTDH